MSNKEIVQSIYQAFAAGDIGAAMSRLDENIEWIEAAGFPYGGTYRGHSAVLEGVFSKLGSEWEDWRAVPAEFIADGQTVVVLGVYTGTFVATGKSFSAPYVHIWKLEDGKARYFQQHTDTLLVDRAIQAG